MNPAKVIVHEIDRDCINVILNLLGKGIGEAGKAAHAHAHGEVLSFCIAG